MSRRIPKMWFLVLLIATNSISVYRCAFNIFYAEHTLAFIIDILMIVYGVILFNWIIKESPLLYPAVRIWAGMNIIIYLFPIFSVIYYKSFGQHEIGGYLKLLLHELTSAFVFIVCRKNIVLADKNDH